MLLASLVEVPWAAAASYESGHEGQEAIRHIAREDLAAYKTQRKETRQTFHQQAVQEREQFRASLKTQPLTREQKKAAIQQFREQQRTKRQAFRQEQQQQYAQWKQQEREKLHGLRQERRTQRQEERKERREAHRAQRTSTAKP